MLDEEDEDCAARVLVWPDELSHLVGETRANSRAPECNQNVRVIGELICLVERLLRLSGGAGGGLRNRE